MGRELKRVALDFEWPLDEVWHGYKNPYYKFSKKCDLCDGKGSSKECAALEAKWYGHAPFDPAEKGSKPFEPAHPYIQALAKRNAEAMHARFATQTEAKRLCDHFNRGWCYHLNQEEVDLLASSGRLMDFTHTFKSGEGWKKKEPEYRPTAQEVNEWSLAGFSHDACNQWVVVNAECDRLGISSECSKCNGHGDIWISEQAKKACEDYVNIEPPEGQGYQIWETVSEGSPISPVFATPQELADYMASHPWGADKGSSFEAWMKFIEGPGWCPSLIIKNGELLEPPCIEEQEKQA